MKIILQRNDEIIRCDEQNLSYKNSQHNLELQNSTINNGITSVNDTITTANNVSVRQNYHKIFNKNKMKSCITHKWEIITRKK